MKISSTVFKSGEKNIKGSNVCCGNIKILNTELLVEGKISKYQTQYSKVAGKISKIKYLWREYQNIKHRVIGGGENIKNIKRTIDQWRNITISSIILVAGKISKAICISGRGRWVIFVSFFECKKMPKGQTLCDLEEVATTLHDLRHEGKF